LTITLVFLAHIPPVLAESPAPAQTAPAKPKPKPVTKIAFFQLEAQGVEQKVSSIVTDTLLAELGKLPDASVIGSKEVDAMLGYEQKKQLSGCTDTSCMVAIGGALGVDKILMGSVGKLGESYTLNLKLINIREAKLETMYNKRLKGAKDEDYLDILPDALATVFPASSEIWKKTGEVQVIDLQRDPGRLNIKKEVPQRDLRDDFKLYGYIGSGVSVACFGVATYFGLKARGTYDDLDAGKYAVDDVGSKVDEGKTAQTVEFASLLSGGVLAAVSGYLLYRGFFGDGTLFGTVFDGEKATVTAGGTF
jgi:hypothetical protein